MIHRRVKVHKRLFPDQRDCTTQDPSRWQQYLLLDGLTTSDAGLVGTIELVEQCVSLQTRVCIISIEPILEDLRRVSVFPLLV